MGKQRVMKSNRYGMVSRAGLERKTPTQHQHFTGFAMDQERQFCPIWTGRTYTELTWGQ